MFVWCLCALAHLPGDHAALLYETSFDRPHKVQRRYLFQTPLPAHWSPKPDVETGDFPGHCWVTIGHGPPQTDYEDEKDAEHTVPRGAMGYSHAYTGTSSDAILTILFALPDVLGW